MVKKVFILLTLTLLAVSLASLVSINLVSAHSSNSTCQEEWICTGWNDCRYGEKERECTDVNHCGTVNDRPDEIKNCYSYDYYYNRDYSYIMSDCSPRALYSPNHYCSRYFRDRQAYLDNYELELMNYYQSKSQVQETQNTYTNQPQQPIQVQLNYPKSNDEERYEQNDKEYSMLSGNLWFIWAIILAVLAFILLITILIVALMRR